MTKQPDINQMVFIALRSGEPHSVLEGLCFLANKFRGEPWTEWLSAMAADAEKLLDKIDNSKDAAKAGGLSKKDIDGLIRSEKDSAKPSRRLCENLAEGLGKYKGATLELGFDPKTRKVMETLHHPESTPTRQLVAFALCLAIRDGYWQSFRRCRDPKCDKLFFDHMQRGRPVARYCCKQHREAHKKRIKRGTS